MSTTVMDGKAVSTAIKQRVKEQIENLKKQNVLSKLVVIIVGDDPASRVYVNNKKKACEVCGIQSEEFALPADTQREQLLSLIDELNQREDVNGILVQLPLPKHLNEKEVIDAISPNKDVDCFSPVNVGRMFVGSTVFAPCTPAGVMEMLAYYSIEVNGKNCVIIGRSNIVGKPMALLLLAQNGTVTICHSRTHNLPEICASADILVAAVGRANFVTADMVKQGAVVVDVGINRNEDGKLCGDVDFENVAPKCSYISPVPGGVGPLTIAMLMQNTLTATKLQNNIL